MAESILQTLEFGDELLGFGGFRGELSSVAGAFDRDAEFVQHIFAEQGRVADSRGARRRRDALHNLARGG